MSKSILLFHPNYMFVRRCQYLDALTLKDLERFWSEKKELSLIVEMAYQ